MEKVTRYSGNRAIFYRPISFLMFYFIGLLILYIWGPMEWKTQSPVILYSFLFLTHALIYVGFSINIKECIERVNLEKIVFLKIF